MKFQSTSRKSQESFELDLLARETLPPPTIPSPRESEVRIKVTRVHAIVDLVTADLQLDPRSEEYIGDETMFPRPAPRFCMIPAPSRSTPAKARQVSGTALRHDVELRRTIPETMRSPVSMQQPISKAQASRERAKSATQRRRAS